MNDYLKNKDKTIITVHAAIQEVFGEDFFSIGDFWDADNFALGLIKKDKLIYISTWDFKEFHGETKCYVEFELVDCITFETKQSIKRIRCLSVNDLISEIKVFVDRS